MFSTLIPLPRPGTLLIPTILFSFLPNPSSSSKNLVGLTWTPLLIIERLIIIIISFSETFRDTDKAKGETVAIRIGKKKKRVSRYVGGASPCRESGVGVAAL